MPNWCNSRVTISAKSPEDADRIWHALSHDLDMRLSITDRSREGNDVIYDVESAWRPQFKGLCFLLNTLEIKPKRILYTAEELGSGLYVSNDPAYVNTYYLSTDNDNWYDLSEAELRDTLADIYGEHCNFRDMPINDLMAWARSEFDDLNIYRCDYEPFETWATT